MGSTQKSIRIQTDINNPQDQYLTVPFDRSIGLIEVLSLKIPMKQEFRRFDSQTGIICGRVFANGNSANNSIGVPNVKVSIFIPKDQNLNNDNLSDYNKTKIKTAELQYPFENPSTKYNGKRFSLLPKWSRNRGLTGFPFNIFGIGNTPKQPIGNRPELEEVLSNEDLSYIEKKYYKYSTTTNKSGDYMIYLPVGDYEIICETDLSDIGPYSVNGHQMTQVMGYPEEYFENGKLKNGVDIDVAPNIIRLTSTVTVKPLWSQNSELTNNPETIGITRQDFRLPVELKANFTIFGTTLNMKRSSWYFDNIIFHIFLFFSKLNIIDYDDGKEISFGISCGGDMKEIGPPSIGNCKCGIGTGTSGGLTFKILFKFNVCIEFPRLTGNLTDGYGISGGGIGGIFYLGLKFCLTLPSMFPGAKIRAFTNRPCVITNGDYGLPPSGIFYLGALEYCKNILGNGYDPTISELLNNSNRIDKTLNRDEELINAENIKTEIKLFSVKNDVVNKNPDSDIEIINDSQYVKIIDDGSFILNINTNKKKMVNTEDGTLVETSDDSSGIFTEFDGYCIFKPEIELGAAPNKQTLTSLKIKVPQNGNDEINIYNSFQNFKFGEYYSISQFIPNLGIGNDCNTLSSLAQVCSDYANLTGHPYKILSPEMNNDGINNMSSNENDIDFNADFNSVKFNLFRGDYLNFLLYFVNIGYRTKYGLGKTKDELSFCSELVKPRSDNNDTVDINLKPNNYPIGGGLKNTQYMSNPNNVITKFIKVDKTDLVRFLERNEKRYETSFFTLKEPQNYPSSFFYKGKFEVDSLNNLIKKNII